MGNYLLKLFPQIYTNERACSRFVLACARPSGYSELVSGAVKRASCASGLQEALESVAHQTVIDSNIFDILGALNCKNWSAAYPIGVFTRRGMRWILNGCQHSETRRPLP
jgi:hypothetical protein